MYKYDLINEAKMSKDPNRIDLINQITNVLGGAFMPAADTSGNLTFASWPSTGYKINQLDNYKILDEQIKNSNAVYVRPDKLIKKYTNENDSNTSASKNKFDWPRLKTFDDNNPKINNATKYRNVATPLFIIPVLRLDNYVRDGNFTNAIKPGIYFYSQDVLGKMGIFGGATINRILERDLFLQFDYNNGVPFFKD